MQTTFTIRGLFQTREFDKTSNKWIRRKEWLTLKEGLTVSECATRGNTGLSDLADKEAAKHAVRYGNKTKWMIDWELQEKHANG